jgi:hypothetical protein
MLRFAGTLIGSALAIGFLVIMLGKPQLSPTNPGSGSVSYPDSSGSVSAEVDDPQVIDFPSLDVEEIPYMESVTDPEPDSLETDPELEGALVEQIFAPEAEREITLPSAPEPVAEEHWYAFWSPFRSEIAAQGFVSKLQETTGIDYRVVKVKTGVYEVAFAYTDDADIQAKLERIASATGLDMSGG